jgi:predicted nucleic acid-binding protein
VDVIGCSLHGRAEFASAAFRKVREGTATPDQYRALLSQLHHDSASGHLKWLPVTEAIVDRVESIFASATTNLRAADALHLACAAEHGFTEVYPNDRQLLAAAPLFGLKGVNVIPQP